MSDVHLDVMPDQSALNGGRCVIKLTGIYYLPADVTFRIDPVDDRIKANSDPGWPGGERRPNDVRLATDGIELVLGPDIVDARLLAPGTPVRVAIAAAAIETELRWPDIPRSSKRQNPKMLPRPEAGKAVDEQQSNLPAASDQSDNPNEQSTTNVFPENFGDDADEVDFPPGMDRYELEARQLYANELMDEEGETPASSNTVVRPPGLIRPFLAGLVLAGILGGGAWFAFQAEVTRYVENLAKARLAAATEIEPQTMPQPVPAPAAPPVLTPPAAVSPNGVPAAGVDTTAALALADKHLRASPPDKPEAQFWLQTALSRAVGSKEMTWGLTQLGTLYATRKSAPDYQRARALWEIAGAHGDPVALCFLGMMYEKGVGAPEDKKRAETYFARASAIGGDCPQRKSAPPPKAKLTESRRPQ